MGAYRNCLSFKWRKNVSYIIIVFLVINIFIFVFNENKVSFTGSCYYSGYSVPVKLTEPEIRKPKIVMPPLLSGTIGLYNNLSAISQSMNIGSTYTNSGRKYTVFLAIGIPTIKRPHEENYLQKTLDSIIANSNDEERSETTVVISLCDFDLDWNNKTAKELYKLYKKHFDSGFFHAIEAPIKMYPPLDQSKGYAGSRDPGERVTWRSKQNVDFAFLMLYSQHLSTYYIQLEDDIMCTQHFISYIKKFIAKNKRWACLEFSNLGFIGKLFQTADLEHVAHLILAFYQYLPCDILLGHIYRIMGQKNPIHYKPSLFQHIGKWSSLENKMMPSIDNEFKDFGKEALNIMTVPTGNNPKATIETDMVAVPGYPAEHAYFHSDEKFFWAKSVRRWSYFRVKFFERQNISRIVISTGDEKKRKDTLLKGDIRVDLNDNCQNFKTAKGIGEFIEGEFDSAILGAKIPSEITCLTIVVAKSQASWLIVRRIEIFVKQNENGKSEV